MSSLEISAGLPPNPQGDLGKKFDWFSLLVFTGSVVSLILVIASARHLTEILRGNRSGVGPIRPAL